MSDVKMKEAGYRLCSRIQKIIFQLKMLVVVYVSLTVWDVVVVPLSSRHTIDAYLLNAYNK